MANAPHLMEFDNINSDVTMEFREKFTKLSEEYTRFRHFILSIPENRDVIFMNMDLDMARDIFRVIEVNIVAEAALADLN